LTFALDNKDRYGYYTVGSYKTYSKLEAIEQHGRTGEPIHWHYNTAVYKQFDWTQEPPGSLETWYAARAQQIRNQYDYIVLWYSGGADSANILQTFVDNGIFIDEVAQFCAVDEADSRDAYINHEIFVTAIPETKKLLDSNPLYKNTVHRLVDIGSLMKQTMLLDDNRWDFFYKVNQYYSINSLARSRLRQTEPAYQKLIDSGKRVCFVWGVEKPVVKQTPLGWYISFRDGQDHGVTAHAQMLNRAWEYDESFYWAPDMPALPAKQGHVLRRYLAQLSDQDVDGVHVLGGEPRLDMVYGTTQCDPHLIKPLITVNNRNQWYSITVRGLNRLMYPQWNPNAVVAGKPHTHLFNPKDAWLFRDNAPNTGQYFYARSIPKLRQMVKQIDPNLWFEFRFDPQRAPYIGGVKAFENSYCLGPNQQ
jgi:hypothetical protein